ncbi:MAG: alpha/beta hydrolase family protein, partial [Planctomycetaceae bacterium]
PPGDQWKLLSLDEGEAEFTLDAFRNDGNTLSFELKKTGATWDGKLNAARDRAEGKWKQNGTALDLTLRQVSQRPDDKPSEVWSGELSVLFQKLPLQFRVYRDADGNEQIRMDSLAQKAGGFLTIRTTEGNRWSLQVPQVAGKFEGELAPDGNSVSGKWSQGGPQLELTLKRSELAAAPAPLKRPQTPRPPFPYEVTEVSFASVEAGVRLAGTMTVPRTPAPAGGFPAAVLISGSGPQDRDETLLEHRPFAVLADTLTRSGTAVLRFDDRGTGQSTGNFAAADSRNFMQDVLGAIRFLQNQPGINSQSV